jgi:predicted ribosomally synthesized peptide with SipW-like signal peptide
MKLNKKKVFVAALAVCLVAIISMGTLAWFSDSDFVKNDFMITDSTVTNPDEVFSVDIYETKVDADGNVVTDANGKPETTDAGNTYDNIAPGDVLTKDPTVKNTGTYNQWVRVKVTLTNAENWLALFQKYNLTLNDLFTNIDSDAWVGVEDYTITGGAMTFTYYLKDQLAPNQTVTLFDKVTIPEIFDQTDIYAVKEFALTFVAEADQVENTKDNAVDAFAFVGM